MSALKLRRIPCGDHWSASTLILRAPEATEDDELAPARGLVAYIVVFYPLQLRWLHIIEVLKLFRYNQNRKFWSVPESSTADHISYSLPIMSDWHWNLDIIVLVILTIIRAIWFAYPGPGGVFNHAIVFLFLKAHSIAVPSNPAFRFVRIPPGLLWD